MDSKRFLPLLAAILAATSLHGQASRTVLDGVYTQEQAERGKAVYDRSCGRCHGTGLDGGGQAPPLHTVLFLDAWREDFLSSLYQHIETRMPPGQEAGTLSQQEYVDIVAYILSFNQLPPGQTELTYAGLATTMLVGPDGPKPLPPSSTVRVVGCFEGSGDDWKLIRATAPARLRNGSETDEKELARSTAAPLGSLTIRLLNLDDEHTEKELLAAVGQKVQAKGVLNGEGSSARVYVLSFQGLGKKCD